MTSHHPFGNPTAWIELADCRLPYWRIGTGPDLVFVHGWPMDARTWRNIVAVLSPRYTCHLFDLPRAGQSSWSAETRIGVEDMGRIVHDAVEHMDIRGKGIGFVGHNSGGGYLRLAAASMGDRVAGIVLGNTETPSNPSALFRLLFSFGGLKAFPGLFRFALRTRLGRNALRVVARQNRAILHGAMTDMFFQPLLENEHAFDGVLTPIRSMDAQDFHIVAEVHKDIGAPVRLVWGRHDPWFRLKAAREMLKSFVGGSDIVVVDDAGLMVHEERPEVFSRAAGEHFDRCFADGGGE